MTRSDGALNRATESGKPTFPVTAMNRLRLGSIKIGIARPLSIPLAAPRSTLLRGEVRTSLRSNGRRLNGIIRVCEKVFLRGWDLRI
jgi:hypothetical protein